MEDQIRKIVREEIARALGAAGEVARGVWDVAEVDSAEEAAAQMLRRTMERVARDVLKNTHPEIPGHAVREDEHTASTEPVHTITAVPERPKATCTCRRHVHVMGQDDRCGSAFCYCLTPVRARTRSTSTDSTCPTCGHVRHVGQPCLEPGTGCRCWEHEPDAAPEDYARTCTVCSHGEHDQGKCGMHVYRDGVAYPCACLASRTLGAQRPEGHTGCACSGHLHRTDTPRSGPCTYADCGCSSPMRAQASTIMCTVCEHAPHGAGNCGSVEWPATAPCECSGVAVTGTPPCSCPGGHRKAVNGQCQMCGHKAHNPAGCTGRRSFE